MDSPLPSTFQAPSIWYDAVAAPQMKSLGNWAESDGCCEPVALLGVLCPSAKLKGTNAADPARANPLTMNCRRCMCVLRGGPLLYHKRQFAPASIHAQSAFGA